MNIHPQCVLKICSAALIFSGLVFGGTFFARAASSATISATAKISVCGNGVKEGGEQCDGSDAGGKTCSDLGYDSGTLDCSASCEYNTSSCTTGAEETAIPLFSSDIGGSYTITDSSDSGEIILPSNFYSDDMRLQMFAFDKSSVQSSEPAPSGESFVGKVYDLRFFDSNGTAISMLSKSATVTLAYAGADTSGIDAGTLAPYRRETNDTAWHPVSGYVLDTTDRTIMFDTDSFSSFAIFGSAPASSAPTSSGGGANGPPIPGTTPLTFLIAVQGSSTTIAGGISIAAPGKTLAPLTTGLTLAGHGSGAGALAGRGEALFSSIPGGPGVLAPEPGTPSIQQQNLAPIATTVSSTTALRQRAPLRTVSPTEGGLILFLSALIIGLIVLR